MAFTSPSHLLGHISQAVQEGYRSFNLATNPELKSYIICSDAHGQVSELESRVEKMISNNLMYISAQFNWTGAENAVNRVMENPASQMEIEELTTRLKRIKERVANYEKGALTAVSTPVCAELELCIPSLNQTIRNLNTTYNSALVNPTVAQKSDSEFPETMKKIDAALDLMRAAVSDLENLND